jgi:putative cardiolipin synthase
VSRAFDIYWNSEFAFPAGALVEEEGGPEALRAVRQRHARTIQAEAAQTYASGLRTSMLQNMMDPRFPLFTGKATVVYDDPAKVERPEEVTTIQSLLRERVHATRSELVVVSPYFVLLDDGLETFRKLRDRGVRIVVLTNSLASTDVVPVHSGYSKAREVLLEAGVEVHEIKPDVSFDEMRKSGIDFTHSSLHMKSFIIDRKSIFFGSFNWDPRSAKINTEIGIFVDSTALAEWAAELLTKRLRTNSYLVRLDADEEIEWLDLAGDEPVVYTKEPKTGGWRRFQAWFFGLLPVGKEL